MSKRPIAELRQAMQASCICINPRFINAAQQRLATLAVARANAIPDAERYRAEQSIQPCIH